jgi:hypothetical protein
VPQKLYEEERVVVEDDSTSRSLVFSPRENLVSFALCRFEPTFPGWKNGIFYDGVTVTRSKKIPQSNRNVIEIESFKQGLKNGLQNFVEELILNHPDIVSSEYFMKLKNAIERI